MKGLVSASVAVLAAVVVGIDCFAAAGNAVLDLAGTWHVKAEGIDSDIELPGTLCMAKLGKRWTRYR